MPRINLTSALRDDYQRLFDICAIRDTWRARVQQIIAVIQGSQARYTAVAEPIGIPWHFIAAIHNMESSLRFDRHLHNGDPLTGRTVHVPAGRPATGSPPFTWEVSAADALASRRLDQWGDWSLPGTLFQLEGYNGWGYRRDHPDVLSPYLWSGSNHYTRGKYAADGVWSPTLVSKQCGAAVTLRRMAEMGVIQFADVGQPRQGEPLLRYSPKRVIPYAADLQTFLNTLPGIYVQVDGKLGPKTSEAFWKVTGYYLTGDPRQPT